MSIVMSIVMHIVMSIVMSIVCHGGECIEHVFVIR